MISRSSSYKICLLFPLLFFCGILFAQKDSTKKMIPVDSLSKKATPLTGVQRYDSLVQRHSPRKAGVRSAILPGLGQIYNQKYWKLPIVYGALGIAGTVFVFNLQTYRDLRYAYKATYQASLGDSSLLSGIKEIYRGLDPNALRTYRDEYRRNIDYSALFFIVLWGLNVVDAVVDAHLKVFDVSPDLSFRFKLGHSELAGTTGLSLVCSIK
jgi:hypothetical protein